MALLAKPKFDPNAPSEDITPTQALGAKPKFDPSAPSEDVPSSLFDKAVSSLAQSPLELSNQGQSPLSKDGLIKGSLDALPMAGAIAGGAAGLASPMPGGAIAGAGLGSAAGESLSQIGKKYLLNEEPAGVGEIAKQGALGAAGEMGGQATGKVIEGITPALQKGGEWLTGIPKKAIETYQKYRREVEALYKSHEGNFATMADEARSATNDAIFAKKADLNKTIETSLKNSDAEVDTQPIRRALIDSQTHLDPKVQRDSKQINQIQNILEELDIAANGSDKIPIQTANRMKVSLQEQASQSYAKPGEIYSLGTDSARAAKKAAAEIRTQMNAELPDLAKANNTHAQLHDLEDNMNHNLIAEGKPEAALLAAGSGANQRNANNLKALGDLIGHDALGDAEKISAARYFGDPALSPVDVTGKALERTSKAKGLGAGLGAVLGFLSGGAMPAAAGGVIGREVGGYIASPLALKGAILTNQGIQSAAEALPNLSRPVGQAAARGLLNGKR
jgi:hypothetical protein